MARSTSDLGGGSGTPTGRVWLRSEQHELLVVQIMVILGLAHGWQLLDWVSVSSIMQAGVSGCAFIHCFLPGTPRMVPYT